MKHIHILRIVALLSELLFIIYLFYYYYLPGPEKPTRKHKTLRKVSDGKKNNNNHQDLIGDIIKNQVTFEILPSEIYLKLLKFSIHNLASRIYFDDGIFKYFM